MKRGDIVDYSFPGLLDAQDADTRIRARPAAITRLAIVRSATATRAEICALDAETWEAPRIVRDVEIDTSTEARTTNRNQADDRLRAIESGTLDTAPDRVKGWVKART